MAAMLMEIKSRHAAAAAARLREDEEDPRAELVRRLLEYEQMKRRRRSWTRCRSVGRDFLAVEVWIEQTRRRAAAGRARAGPRRTPGAAC